ncbi:UNVERIFIED_CONTAM: Asparagine--tRNA ligase, cytoplasmic 3 [Sesamum radiatum]|uniref:Asparagine--tRNA ligase, cytoplasmic 3 n=1 Tax=Sesamum radiatum TaxID=300843 RepID=A0AAW2W0B3_SESRA
MIDFLPNYDNRYLTKEKFRGPVIVYNHPKASKAFYMKVGELIGGGQREENYEAGAKCWRVCSYFPKSSSLGLVTDDMNCAEAFVRILCQWLLDHCSDDLELTSKFIDKTALQQLEMVAKSKFPRVAEAVAILEEATKVKKFENKVELGIDSASEHERKIAIPCIHHLQFINSYSLYMIDFLPNYNNKYNHPKASKAFYMKVNEDNKTIAATDVLVPKVRELIGDSQR